MLELVFGPSGYGKTEYVFNSIKSLVLDEGREVMLITPEQFSLIAERRLLTDLGEKGVRLVDNSSFSRLSDTVRREYGCEPFPVLSKGGKAVMMMKAIDLCRDNLVLFGKKLDSLNFVNSMIDVYDEMKSCNLSSFQIREMSSGIENVTLREKLKDISLIMNSYETLISDHFLDSASELNRVYDKLKDVNYFKDKIVFIDGFNGFVAQEYKILELIIKESERAVITLCTDEPHSDDSFSLFGYVNNSASIISRIAVKAGVEIKEKFLTENHRAANSAMLATEKNIFQNGEEIFDAENCVSIYSAKSITDECSQAARQIRQLLRNGVKAKEIAVITRDIEKYRGELSVFFKKYEIPFFNDERQPIKNQPLVLFIEYLLRCVNYSFRSDDILSLAKTGLTNIPDENINALENYIYIWNINGLKWTKPFENSTKGFTGELDEKDKQSLEKINETREALIKPLEIFKKSVKDAEITDLCSSVYHTLIKFGVDEKIRENAVFLANHNKTALAEEQGRVWDFIMEILNMLTQIYSNGKVNLKEFAKVFSLVVSAEDLGTVPAGIDNIQFGQADRIRTDNPKAVFILGANEGEFPQSVSGAGLLTESDRRILLENDFKLYSYGEILNLQERYFAYMACSAPSEKLYVSFIGADGKDENASEIVSSLKSLFNLTVKSIGDISDIELVETRQNSFELMCDRYFYNTTFYSSLKEVFGNDSRFATVRDLAENKKTMISKPETAVNLFDKNMYVSASRVEDFYNCSFRYFCKFGLNARPRRKAEIDPMQRGTLIHFVLEMILSSVGSKALSQMNESEIRLLVDKYTNEFFVSEMGAASGLTARFNYNYKRLSKLIYGVVIHLAKEFSESDFEAKAFELGIDRDGQVKPEILSLYDGGTIQIRGSIDRVDTYDKDGQRYVRVVDYKSGSKSFNLSDVMYGLNLQMFIYLFSLCSDDKAALSGIPAGVLYMHSSRNVFSFDSRKSAINEIDGEESSSFKMKGIVLDDGSGDIARAMEHSLAGKYIPVKEKKDGELTGKLASLEELGKIHKKINSLVTQMGMELHSGNISHNPIQDKNHKNTCEYCDYQDVCSNRRSIEKRILPELTEEEVKEELSKEFDDSAPVDTATE